MESRPMLNIVETNCALLGSELERKVKEAAAAGEEAWIGAGTAPGIQVWRIEKFRVVPWPKSQYGQFFDGDSYIVLSTTTPKEEQAEAGQPQKLLWDVHFWLGRFTTQDEAGTAAYKTVELDDTFHDAAIQHREVQGAESPAFLSLFGGSIRVLNGGIESGFRHVDRTAATRGAALFHVAGPTMRTVRVTQLPKVESKWLAEEDCFLLDDGFKTVYSFIGSGCSHGEASKAALAASQLASEVPGGQAKRVTSEEADEEFWKALGGRPDCVPPKLRPELLPLISAAAAAANGAERQQQLPEPELVKVDGTKAAAMAQGIEGLSKIQALEVADGVYGVLWPEKNVSACIFSPTAPKEVRFAGTQAVHEWLGSKRCAHLPFSTVRAGTRGAHVFGKLIPAFA